MIPVSLYRIAEGVTKIWFDRAFRVEVPSNGEAQPPADEYSILKRCSGEHEAGFQNRTDSAGRLERNVSWLRVPIVGFLQVPEQKSELDVSLLTARILPPRGW